MDGKETLCIYQIRVNLRLNAILFGEETVSLSAGSWAISWTRGKSTIIVTKELVYVKKRLSGYLARNDEYFNDQ